MNRQQLFRCFEFKNDFVLNKKIQPQFLSYLISFVNQRNRFLSLIIQTLQFKFHSKTVLVY